MKLTKHYFASIILMIFFSIMQLSVLAQEESSSSTTSSSKTEITVTDATSSEWYASPWVWVAGAAVFILLLVALLSGRGSDRDKVVVNKTVVDRDRDTVVRDRDTDVV